MQIEAMRVRGCSVVHAVILFSAIVPHQAQNQVLLSCHGNLPVIAVMTEQTETKTQDIYLERVVWSGHMWILRSTTSPWTRQFQ